MPANSRTEYLANWYKTNRARILARNKAHYRAHTAEKAARVNAWRQKNPKKVQSYLEKYQKANPDRLLAANRRWYRRNLAAQLLRNRVKNAAQYKVNKEAILARNRKWAQAHPIQIKVRDARRRALLKGAEVNMAQIQEWITTVKSKRFAFCYWCHRKIHTSKIHFDHVVPLAKGGPHSVDNLCVSCAHCNLQSKAGVSVHPSRLVNRC